MAEAVLHQPDASKRRHALLRHEWKIVSAGLSAMFGKPIDLLTVLIVVPVALLVLKAWTANQSERLLGLHAFTVGLAVAFYSVKALLGRGTYHRSDGILAAHAQRKSEQFAFALPLFGGAVALGLAYVIIVGAHRPAVWLAGTTLGAMAGFAWVHIARIVSEQAPVLLRWLNLRQRRHSDARLEVVVLGGVLGAAVALAPFRLSALAIATVAVSLIVAVVLGRVDAAAVRYRTMVGHSSWAIVRSHIVPLATFFGPFAATLALAPHWAPPTLALMLGSAVTVFVAMRILAYQSFQQRIADWFVTGLIAVVAMVGFALPPAGPVAMLVGIVWLARRSATQKWLIA